MKSIILFLALIPFISSGQNKSDSNKRIWHGGHYIKSASNLTLEAAFKLSEFALESASALKKDVSVAILDSNGSIILLLRGNDVGVHNTEASRRKAYTALSTKTATLELMQKAAADSTAQNLNTLPELLLLGGGVPVWNESELVGSVGVSGAGGGLNDHHVAKRAIEKLGFTTQRR